MSKDFNTILKELLDKVPETLYKRQGSIIYDALAPAALKLAELYTEIEIYYYQTYLATATGSNLDNRVADYGLSREDATYAIRLVNVYNTNNELYDIDIGSRFSIPEDYGGYNYVLTEKISTGIYKAKCETAGTVGNEYLGILLPLYNISGLGKAEIVSTYQAAEDIEDDDSLRKRAVAKLNTEPFGGNQSDYKRYLKSIDGVGASKIFPIWNGGGTVKISLVNSDNTIPDNTFINDIQTLIDPIANQGEGLGLAPIGHTVTVVAPTATTINIQATLVLDTGYTISQVAEQVISALNLYIKEIQENWENSSTAITIYRAKIIAAILTVTGIVTVSTITINSASTDLVLSENSTTQQFPYLGEVTLNED